MQFNVGVVLVCAGLGKRLGKIDKSSLSLSGKPLFYHAYKAFASIRQIKKIVIVLRKEHFGLAQKLIDDRRVIFVQGGKERRDSVCNGINSFSKDITHVLIHDGARPFVTTQVISNVLTALKKSSAVICGIKAKDTLKVVKSGVVKNTLNREDIYCIQTPQGFKKSLILKAYKEFKGKNLFDDAGAVEALGKKVKVVEGNNLNFKITYLEDIVLAKGLVK